VAIAPYYPPLAFEQGDSVTGVEVELANLLGKELNRPVEFVKLKRDDLINAVQDGRADIIMSGMSVTKARQIRAKFSEPYLHNQLRAIFKRSYADKFQSPEDVKASTSRIGVLAGTTSDAFVQKNCPYATRIVLQNRRDVTFWLTEGGKIDLYIDDSFALAQIVSENEAALAYLPQPLAEDNLAWAVAPGQEHLLQQVNEYLARWKATGQLDLVLQHWMPYLKKP
jgi:polar amino acid transport system substrate-binding protein